MNLNNRVSVANRRPHPFGEDNFSTDIPLFQTVQTGRKKPRNFKKPLIKTVNNCSTSNSQQVEKESEMSSTSSSNISTLLSFSDVCHFPVARRNTLSATKNLFEEPIATTSNAQSVINMLHQSSKTSSKTLRELKENYRSDSDTDDHDKGSVNHTPIFKTPTDNKSSSSSTSNFFSTPKKSVTFATNQTPKPTSTFRTPKSATIRTPKSTSSGNSSETSNVVVVLTEGRGSSRGEVGLAAMDTKRPCLILCQINDTLTYTAVLRKVHILNPAEIIIPNTFYENMTTNKLFQVLSEQFPKIQMTTLQRKYFSETDGFSQVKMLCLEEYSSVIPLIQRKYYTLAAAAALLKYVEFQQNIIFTSGSLRIDYQGGDNVVFIDIQTAERLELITSQNSETSTSTLDTLFKILNKCCTLSGQKRLRMLILQPSANIIEINSRLNCVQELIEKIDLLLPLKSVLPKFWDVEQLLCLCGQSINYKENETAAEMMINCALVLKTTLEAIPALQNLISHGESDFFKTFSKILKNEKFEIMLQKIYTVLNDDAHLSAKFEINFFQRCFSVKTGLNSFLDIGRVAYTELVNDFNEIVGNLISEYRLPLTIKTMKNKGFVLHMKVKPNFKVENLPNIFIQVQKMKSGVTMTTRELLFLKERMKHFIQEIQLISSTIIFELLQEIRQDIAVLYKLCENIAELDLIVSFAIISKDYPYVRPTFTQNSMCLKSSVHPILHYISRSKPIPNDIVASNDENMIMITGPNMGGKSIYIRQVALLQIMSQIGCYVPAESAVFRITDHIFSRIGFHDNIECNASSFIVEVTEMQYIIKSLTPNSLVIIDELCRGTSTEEGTALAWAISEELLASTAFIFCTTHFLYLTKLQDLYPNVLNYHLETLELNSEAKSLNQLVYTHHLLPGVIKLENYGLKLAQSTAIPQEIIRVSEEMAKKLSKSWKGLSTANQNVTNSKQIDDIIVKLLEVLDNGLLTVDVLEEMMNFANENGVFAEMPPQQAPDDVVICDQAEDQFMRNIRECPSQQIEPHAISGNDGDESMEANLIDKNDCGGFESVMDYVDCIFEKNTEKYSDTNSSFYDSNDASQEEITTKNIEINSVDAVNDLAIQNWTDESMEESCSLSSQLSATQDDGLYHLDDDKAQEQTTQINSCMSATNNKIIDYNEEHNFNDTIIDKNYSPEKLTVFVTPSEVKIDDMPDAYYSDIRGQKGVDLSSPVKSEVKKRAYFSGGIYY